MKSYEEIAASVFEKRDAHEARRKKRMALIGKCSTVGAGFCCIALIAVGVYKGELSDVQEFKEYVGNPTEATTEAVTTQDASSESGSTGGSYTTNAPSAGGEATDGNIQTGVMVDDAYLNEDYIYIIQDPTEPPEQQESTTLPNGETVTRPPTGSGATDTTQTETSQGNSNEQATTEDPFNCGGWYDPSGPIPESPNYPTNPPPEINPSEEKTESPVDPSEESTNSPVPPTTTSDEFLGSTEIVTQPVTKPETEIVTSIVCVTDTTVVVTESTEAKDTEGNPTEGEKNPLYQTYDEFTLAGINYRTLGTTLKPTAIGESLKTDFVVMADDGESYVKIDIYLITIFDQSVSVAIKYEGDSNYYMADAV